MAVDKVKPLKLENPSNGGTQTDVFPTEVNTAQDYIAAKGVAIENSDNLRLEQVSTDNLGYSDPTSGTKTFKSLKAIDFSYNDTTLPYIKTTTNTFDVVARFVFRGTDQLATPSVVRAIAFMKDLTQLGEVRLFDLTNNVILGTAGFSGINPQLVTISTSGWPTAAAIIEVQIRSLTAGKESRISGLSLEW